MKQKGGTPYLLFISGPTSSGKTDLSLKLAQHLKEIVGRGLNPPVVGAQIINADIGQFYQPLVVGTAKPAWKNQPVPHHLFDIVVQPKDMDVSAYRAMMMKVAQKIWDEGDVPIVVGGSLFYIRSLFFTPKDENSFTETGYQ